MSDFGTRRKDYEAVRRSKMHIFSGLSQKNLASQGPALPPPDAEPTRPSTSPAFAAPPREQPVKYRRAAAKQANAKRVAAKVSKLS